MTVTFGVAAGRGGVAMDGDFRSGLTGGFDCCRGGAVIC